MEKRERAFTSFEAAKACGVFHTTLVGWVNQGRLKARVTPGGHRRIMFSDLIAFMRKYEMPVPPDLVDRPKKILIVEDNAYTQQLFTRIFKALPGAHAELCASGLQALISIGKDAPDLLVLDIYIPELNGMAVCKLLRSVPDTRPIKIIAVSGEPLTDKDAAFLRENADCFFEKPFIVSEFVAKAAELLGIEQPRPKVAHKL